MINASPRLVLEFLGHRYGRSSATGCAPPPALSELAYNASLQHARRERVDCVSIVSSASSFNDFVRVMRVIYRSERCEPIRSEHLTVARLAARPSRAKTNNYSGRTLDNYVVSAARERARYNICELRSPTYRVHIQALSSFSVHVAHRAVVAAHAV